MDVRLASLTINADAANWHALGLEVARPAREPSNGADGCVLIGTTRLDFVPDPERVRGITGWTIAAAHPVSNDIDGLATTAEAEVDAIVDPGEPGALRATRIDHVVVMTPSLDRTCGAIEVATGAPLRRIRDAGKGVRQGFHRMGEVIVEVVERPDIPADAPASFWGLVIVVEDLDAAAAHLGEERLYPGKAAVQPGRRIATVTKAAGLGLPVALMTD